MLLSPTVEGLFAYAEFFADFVHAFTSRDSFCQKLVYGLAEPTFQFKLPL
jgi:hypothetical protein